MQRAITQLGLLLGKPVEARSLVREIQARERQVDLALAREPIVSVFVDTGYFTTVPDQSLIGDVIRIAHGRNVAGGNPEPGPFDLEELARADPDFYLATSDANVALANLRLDPRTKKLRAIRRGKFAIADIALLAPGPHIGDGIVEVARLLHPDAFR